MKKDEYEKAASTSRSEDDLRGEGEQAQQSSKQRSKKFREWIIGIIVLILLGGTGIIIRPYFVGEVRLYNPY